MRGETLPALLRQHAATRPAAIALEFGGRLTSFAALETWSTQAAQALLATGAARGSRIGYLGKNSDRYFELLVAAAKAGLVMVPIGWRLTSAEIAYLVADAEVTLLFVEPAFHPAAAALAANVPELRLVSSEDAVGHAPAFLEWRSAGINARYTCREPDPAEPVLQLYTSGTTGRPKGAVLSHANLFGLRPLSAAAGVAWDRWEDSDVSLLAMPVAHIAGTGWGTMAFYHGAKSIIMPEFDAGQILRTIAGACVSRIFLVPTAIHSLLRHPDIDRTSFVSLRYMFYGASPVPLDLLREAMAVFGCSFVQHYGMTETCGTIVALAPEDHDPADSERMVAAGRAVPGVELRIVDEMLRPVLHHITGEILVKSPSVMLGYWNRPDATEEGLTDGWLRTGDAGYLDEDGYLFVQDRLKDTIISGGENVYPAEVESVLFSHPDVADAAVIGTPDDRWGEAVTAIVVTNGQGIDEAALLAWARERLAPYKVPKRILVRDALPRNANGKILRRVLREPFWADQARQVN